MIQLAAASLAGLASLRYHTTDRNFADKISKALRKFEKENYNTGQLMEDLENFGKSDKENISFLETYH